LTLQERFEKYVEVDFNNCWIWVGTKTGKGYGYLQVRKKTIYAKRLSYEWFIGPIPEGKEICHSCDNRPCVNPDHLWPGTHLQNMQDRDSKGRQAKLEENGRAKLKLEEVLNARSLGLSQRKTAKLLGVCRSQARRILRGEQWNVN
jgi:hypothetical protein